MKNDINRNRINYWKLLIANSINRFGDSIDALALTWLVYAATGSPFWSATFYACNQLPSVIIQPIAGAIVETKNKKQVMVYTDILRGFAVIIIAILYIFNIIHPIITIIFAFFVSTVEAFRLPAGNAFITLIVDEEYYESAVAKNTSLTTIFSLFGTAIAGVIITFLGTATAIIIDAVTFLLSALIISLIKINYQNKRMGSIKYKEQLKQYYHMFLDGINYAKESSVIKGLIVLVLVFNGMLAPINSLVAPLISGYYGLGSSALSAFSISLSIGMAIAGFTFVPLAERIKSPQKMLSIGALLFGLVYLFLVSAKNISENMYFLLAIIAFGGAIIGYIVSANTTMLTVNFLRKVAKTHIARIAALYNSVASASIPFLAFLLGIATEYTSTYVVFIATGILCLIFGLIMMLKKDINS